MSAARAFSFDGAASGPKPRRAARAPKLGAALAAVALFVAVAGGCGAPQSTAQSSSSASGTGGSVAASGGAGAGGTTTGTHSGPVDFCTDCSLQTGCSAFVSGDLIETSGLAASVLHDGAYYVHNDSGDSARFFATSCAGDDLGIYEVKDAANVDWEDMARGPCADAGKSCLYFADSGDNLEARTDYAVYRVAEPTALGAGTHKVTAEKFPFVYPDGSHDSETLLVHPLSGEMAVVTKLKEAGKSGVYAFPMPLTPGVTATLVKTGEVAPPTGSIRITGGSVHPGGAGILLRTYTSLFFYALDAGQTLGPALSAPPCEMPVMLELQGESVSFTASGAGYVTASEKTGQSLHFASCP